jgi:PAS domain-containing protein
MINSGASKINFEELQHRGGDTNWLRTSKIPISDINGKTIAVLGLYEDITERKSLEQKLQSMAHYDSLTGLANRAFFIAMSTRRFCEAGAMNLRSWRLCTLILTSSKALMTPMGMPLVMRYSRHSQHA